MHSSTGLTHTIMRSLGRPGLPLLAALALLVFATLIAAMLALELILAAPEAVVSAPLRW